MSVQDFHDRVVNLQSVDLFQYLEDIPELKLLQACEQSPEHHAEGNVLIHANMAGQIILHLIEQEDIRPVDKVPLYLATLLHDIGKPSTSIFNKKKNKITAYGHDEAGVQIANEFIRKYFPECVYSQKELILRLIENHMHPRLWMKDGTVSVARMKTLSLAVNTKLLYLLSQA